MLLKEFTLSVCDEGNMTVGCAVSTEVEVLAGLEDDEDSSIESEAIAPGVGARVAGILVGGCCFFLIMSL